MMRRIFLMAAATLALAAPAGAQVSLELRGGAAVGNHEIASSGLDVVPGPSFAAAVEVGVMPSLSAYAGYSRIAFGCEEGFCAGSDVTFASQGVSGGVRVHLPRLPWVRAGVLYHGINADGGTGDGSEDAGIGFELATGGTVPLTPRLSLLPGLAYRRHTSSADGQDGFTATLGAEVGLRFSF